MASSLPSLTESDTDSDEYRDQQDEMQNRIQCGRMANSQCYDKNEYQTNDYNHENNFNSLNASPRSSSYISENEIRRTGQGIDINLASLEANDDSLDLPPNQDRHLGSYNTHNMNRRGRQLEYNDSNNRTGRRPNSYIDLDESMATNRRSRKIGYNIDPNFQHSIDPMQSSHSVDRRGRSPNFINERSHHYHYNEQQPPTISLQQPTTDFVDDTDIYLTPSKNISNAIQQNKRISCLAPKTSKKRKASRYDEDNYALPNSSSSKNSSKDNVKVDINVNVESKSKFLYASWKLCCLLTVCLCIGIGAGVTATIVMLDKNVPQHTTNGKMVYL